VELVGDDFIHRINAEGLGMTNGRNDEMKKKEAENA
jgi:hypothetical protein